MADALLTTRKCELCGRYGQKGFRWLPISIVHGTKVGGYWVCKGLTSCRRRRSLPSQGGEPS